MSAVESCKDYVHLLGAYLDGRLDAAKLLEVEEHAMGCEPCSERVALDGAVRHSLKRSDEAPKLSEEARQRILNAMSGEVSIERTREETSRLFGWKAMLPLSAAAGVTLVWSAIGHAPVATESHLFRARGGIDNPLADLIAEHSRPLPAEVREPSDIRALERYIGVPIRTAAFERSGARLVGGRVLPVHQERAAMLQYEIGQGTNARRVSLFIYDPQKIHVQPSDFATRGMGRGEVQVGKANGYSIAVTQRSGVGYTVATDLDTERSVQFAALTNDED